MAVNDGNKNKDSIPSTERTVQESPSRKKHEAPTIKKYLDGLTEVVLTHGGDFRGQLEDAVQSFSSCFSRLARKRILRKIWAAFDATGTGFITKQQFYMGIEETAAEFRVDFPDFERKILGEFLFPDADKSLIDYEKLLEVCKSICSSLSFSFFSQKAQGYALTFEFPHVLSLKHAPTGILLARFESNRLPATRWAGGQGTIGRRDAV